MNIQSKERPQVAVRDSKRQPRLLVIDDEVENAQALKLYLTRQGYDVGLAYNAAQAQTEIKENPPDLLILDLNLPDMSGFQLTMQVRADPKFNYLPVIIVTAEDEERKRLQSMVSGADDYLPKPVAERDLLVRVQALLRTKAQIDILMEDKRRLNQDLEERNAELEKALKQVEDAQNLKKNILNAVSHEMGTPMLQIKSAVHLLVEDVRKTDADSPAAKLATQVVSRMEGIIQNITDLARMEDLKPEVFLIKDAVDLAVRTFERSWAARNAVGRIEKVFSDEYLTVMSDRRAVARILQLLLDNAIKFDPDGNTVTVDVMRDTPDKVRVAVIDQGIGISKEHRELIFKEFYQIDSSTTRRFGGSGVGLTLVKLLCERLGTEIHVKSSPRRGSTFSFMLPMGSISEI